LIKLNKSIKLAKSGHSLLKKKRDGLILEFFEILKNAKSMRSELAALYTDGQKKINITRTLYTDLKLRSLAHAMHDTPTIKLETKNIMGVSVPKIESSQIEKTIKDRKIGILGSTAAIDEGILAYEKLVDKILQVAEIETAIKRLLSEIEKTKRRVNALEFSVIPKMEETKTFIKFRLEEMERENIFRLKRVKAKAA
jgi:V/A-type H+-transporting ATPase subunit D